jgi:hypothetical protein
MFHDDGKHVDLFNSDGMNCKAEEYTYDGKSQVNFTHAQEKDDCINHYLVKAEAKWGFKPKSFVYYADKDAFMAENEMKDGSIQKFV